MEIGMSTASMFCQNSLEDNIPLMAEKGVTLCEVFLNTWHEYQEDYINLLSSRINQHGISVYSIHPMGSQFEPQLFSIHPRQRNDALHVFKKVLMAGKALKAKCYVMHGPANLGGAVKNVQFSRIGPIVQDLCDIALDYNIKIAWENVSWAQYSYPMYGPELLYATGKDDLRFTLDIKQAARSGFSPMDYLHAAGDKIINLHLCDYKIENERLCLALPGAGQFDFYALTKKLKEIGYGGPALLEVYSDMYNDIDELFNSYEQLKKVIQHT